MHSTQLDHVVCMITMTAQSSLLLYCCRDLPIARFACALSCLQCNPEWDAWYLQQVCELMCTVLDVLAKGPSPMLATTPQHQMLEAALSLKAPDAAASLSPLPAAAQRSRAALLAHRLARWAACVLLSVEMGAALMPGATPAGVEHVASGLREVLRHALPVLLQDGAQQEPGRSFTATVEVRWHAFLLNSASAVQDWV